MKRYIAEMRTLALQTEHPRIGTFSAFVEDVSDNREIFTNIVIFVMCKGRQDIPRAVLITVLVALGGFQG